MRKTLTLLAAVPALIVAPGAHADALPSFTVPTFSVSYLDYEPVEPYGPPSVYPAAAHVVSTSTTATVISLDSHEDQVHSIAQSTYVPAPSYVASTLRFEAAEGYRITSVLFSATAVLSATPGYLAPGAVILSSYKGGARAWADMGLAPAGTDGILEPHFRLYEQEPVELRAQLYNSADLRTFDLISQIGVLGTPPVTYYTVSHSPGMEFKSIGRTEAWYLDPTLTVFTAPVPEPTTWAMLGAGLLIVGFASRRKRA